MDQNYGFYQPENTPIPTSTETVSPEEKLGKKYAVASLVLGILALAFTTLCCCLILLSPILAILSIIFALLAKKKLGKFTGLMIAGLILSIIALLIFLMMIVTFGTILSEIENMEPEELTEFMAESFGMSEAEFEEFFESTYGMPYEEFLESFYNTEATAES